MQPLREIAVITSLVSAICFGIYFAYVFSGHVASIGPFPIGISVLGAIFMCCLPVYIIKVGGSKQGALIFAIATLLVGLAHVLSIFIAK